MTERKLILLLAVLGASVLIYSCSHNPYAETNKSYKQRSKSFADTLRMAPGVESNDSIKEPQYFVGTTNFSLRKPNFVIIHHTAQHGCPETLKTFTTVSSKVSAHYVICKDGTVHHILNDYMRAWHAGISRWGNLIDVNSSSIGIELDNTGFEPFDDAQIKALISLLGKLKKEYDIPTANFIGHSDIAPKRKIDPNYRFPWKTLADKGFGLWYDDARAPVPDGFDDVQALRIIGYDIKDTSAAIGAFKRHFMQDTTSKKLNSLDKSVLLNLSKKYM